jgi:hypothetical protein
MRIPMMLVGIRKHNQEGYGFFLVDVYPASSKEDSFREAGFFCAQRIGVWHAEHQPDSRLVAVSFFRTLFVHGCLVRNRFQLFPLFANG